MDCSCIYDECLPAGFRIQKVRLRTQLAETDTLDAEEYNSRSVQINDQLLVLFL
jgi:hypothetical protein